MIRLARHAYASTHTEGELFLAGFSWPTIELPWKNNTPKQSCIPEGAYRARLGQFNAGGYECIELLGVPGRSLIKLHIANCPSELLGCIAPGLSRGVLRLAKNKQHEPAVLESARAFRQIMKLIPRDRVFDFHVVYEPHLLHPGKLIAAPS